MWSNAWTFRGTSSSSTLLNHWFDNRKVCVCQMFVCCFKRDAFENNYKFLNKMLSVSYTNPIYFQVLWNRNYTYLVTIKTYCAMIMTHTWKVLLLILKWALNVKSLYIGTSLLTKSTNLWLNRLTDGWCNAAARTTSLLVGELVLPQANNCINSGGSSKASTRKRD